MTDNHYGAVNPAALYKTRQEALDAPGQVYTHFKGGVYRKLGDSIWLGPTPKQGDALSLFHDATIKVVWQSGDFEPEDGGAIVIYEHIFPHQHGYFVRDARDFNQYVEKGDYNYQGPRFAPVVK